jgi:hypothetical protein
MGLAGGGAAVVQAGLQQYSNSRWCGKNTGRHDPVGRRSSEAAPLVNYQAFNNLN